MTTPPVPKTTELIALGVTTLDEARYFAAMGVHWIGFDGSRVSVDEMQTMMEWVIGPKFFAEFASVDEDALFELFQKTSLHGICLPRSVAAPSWYSGNVIYRSDVNEYTATEIPAGITVLFTDLPLTPEPIPGQLPGANPLWMEVDPSTDVSELMQRHDIDGIAIRCIGSSDNAYDLYDRFFGNIES
jgi:hypothetical protein